MAEQPTLLEKTTGFIKEWGVTILATTVVIVVIVLLTLWDAGKLPSGFELFNGNPPGPWKMIGSATLADVSNLGHVQLPLEEAVMQDTMDGTPVLVYRYRLVITDNNYLYLTGTSKAYNGMGKYLLGNQPIPPGYGGLYVLNITREGIPSGFRLPGFRNLGLAAEVMVNGRVGPYKHLFQGRKQYLNPSRYEYRVVFNPNSMVYLQGDQRINDGDMLKPVPSEYPPAPYSINVSYQPGIGMSQPNIVAYKIKLDN